MARIRHVDGTSEKPLAASWQCAASKPGTVSHPSELSEAPLQWFDARVPGTIASALATASAWDVDRPRDIDAEEWWLRCVFRKPVRNGRERQILRFGGLATLADVWLAGKHLLRSDNMFLEHEVDLPEGVPEESELVLRFGALGPAREAGKARPRWRSTIVARQQLRWVRTALFGRMPAFSPACAHVGAYRPITLETQGRMTVVADLKTRIEGGDGIADLELRVRPLDGARVNRVTATVGDETTSLALSAPEKDGTLVAKGCVRVSRVALWWPCTHGLPALHEVRATVFTTQAETGVSLGRTGFRSIEIDRANDGFGLRVNGVDLFCRGASWMPLDAQSLWAPTQSYSDTLKSVRDAGMNMLRVSGTTLYESQDFYDLCDELGLMVWQDFMFANMDYPAGDETFCRSVNAEATQVLDRLQVSPSIAILCGNTEIAQQAAMLGFGNGEGSNHIFTDILPKLARALRPDVPYVETSPFGGSPPFRADMAVSHYYGVGAYRRPVEDARRAGVRFASECLAFANLPCDETIRETFTDGETPPTHPAWKSRVPRDRGASWDFEDVRDHYLGTLTGVEPAALRATDVDRYFELSRAASGHAMAGAMTEWRRSGSVCRGALVWTLRDLWPGAGWGIFDALGRPKAAYYFLKRVLQPVALLLTDEGLNGLMLHAMNDTPDAIDATLRLVLYRGGEIPVADETASVRVPARGAVALPDAAVLGRFVDATYAYRFGPPGHDLVVATLLETRSRRLIGQAFHCPTGLLSHHFADPNLEAVAEPSAPGEWRVTVRAKRFALAVAFAAPGFVPEDDFFNVEPGGERLVTLRGGRASLSACVKALNAPFASNVSVHS
jgi:beta-mannosidase